MAESAEGKAAVRELGEKVKAFENLARAAIREDHIYTESENARKALYAADVAMKEIEGLSELAVKASVNDFAVIEEDINNALKISIAMAAIVVVVSTAVGWMLSSNIAGRMEELTEAAGHIAEGDLTQQVRTDSGDEIGEAMENFEVMRRRMQDTISEINVASDQVAAGSGHVSQASVALSQGASEQAAVVEELSASISEIASQTVSNAGNADRANELTVLAHQHAEDGNVQMKKMLTAMDEINTSSANISKIIRVIDEIAFQTNILALNAAVEAARAGQHGKGFAVVAEEVRNLAARSAKAAKETTDMIAGSIEKVNDGHELANKTAEALQTIVGNVADVADIVSAIAKASNEQKLALDQINQGVLQVSQVVQANSATSEEAAAASEQLNAQAERMKEAVTRFKV